jgi:hypothetical protein
MHGNRKGMLEMCWVGIAAMLADSATVMVFGVALFAAPVTGAVAPAHAAEAPPPAATAAPAGEEKPKRRAARRKPAPVQQVAAIPSAPARTPRHNDVMTGVMYRDSAGTAEIIEMGGWVDRPATSGMTPLMAAAANGDAEMTGLLLRHGANPNLSAPGGSVMAYAHKGGNAQVVQLLRQAGAK